MADTIGPLTPNRVSGFVKNGRRITVLGDMASEGDYKELEELCRDADVNFALYRIRGGKTKGEDLTTDSLYTVYCTFDDPSVPDGWYIITGPVKRREDAVVMWFFEVPLFLFSENEAIFGGGLTLKDLSTLTNDWDL